MDQDKADSLFRAREKYSLTIGKISHNLGVSLRETMSLSAIDAQRHISHTADSNGNPPADGQIPTGQSILGATQNLAMTPTPADDYEAVKARFFGALRAKNNIERAKIFHTASIDVVARLANEIDSSLEDSGKIIILDSETIANILKTRGMTPERVIAILSHDLLNIEKTAKILLAMDRFCFMFVATKSAQILIEMCRRNHVSRAAKIVMVMCKQCEILFAANILVTMLRTSEESSDNSGISILDYMLKNSSDKAIIIKIFLAMNRFISKEILENNQAVCEILVRTLCDESMSCKNLVAFFDKMLCLSSEFRDIACKAIAQMESENAAKAKECLGKLPIVSVGYIFEEKLKSTSDAVIFWKKIWPLDPKKAMKIFPGSTNDRNLTESFAAFLLEMDRQNSENPGTLPSVSELLLCESFYRGAVAKILTCSLMPEEKAIEITGKMYRLNFKETIKIFTEVVEIGMSDTRSRDIGIKIFLKIDEIDSENPANLSSVIEILLMKYPSMKSFIRYEFSTSNLVDIDRVVKILKELHGARFPLAMKVFKYLLRRNPRAAEIFLKFYQAADCRQMAMKILSDDTIKPKDIIKLLLNDSLGDGNAAKILKDLHDIKPLAVVQLLNNIFLFPNQVNGANRIFSKLYHSETDHRVALKILSDGAMNIRTTTKLLLSDSLGDGEVLKILKELYKENSLVVMNVFNCMFITAEQFNGMPEIFLKFYQAADCRQMAMKILSDDTIKPKDIIKLLLNDSLDDDNAAKILKDLLVENFEKAIKVLLKMTEYTLPLKKRAAVLFCELMKNCDDAVEIFLNDAITCNHVCGIFESKHISSVQMANVLITIYTPDTVNKIAEVLRFVCCTSKLRSKVARALRQMDPDKVDSLLDTQFLSPYASAIRSMMEMTTEFKPMTHCYEEEFAVRFHALNAEVEQGESESTDIPQNEAMPADKFPLDENIPSDEIPLADDVDDGEISLETSETPPPSFLEQFREFFKGSADNLLIVAAVAVVSGLALWAVVLWPLAALIGAGCTAVTLSAILLFRNRSANGSKSQEVNPLNFDGNDPFKINGISMVEA